MQHSCPYCTYPITRDNVLFQYNPRKMPYRDERRFAFYNLCSSSWPMPSDRFEGLYFLPSDAEEGEIICDESNFPLSIRVKPCNGKTPTELEAFEIPGAPLTDFIAQYKGTNSGAAETPADSVSSAASVFGIADDQKAETEYKPVDDGTTIILATRVCPNCHNELHQRFGRIQTINVTLLGGASAGKTAYLLSLVHQLSVQLSARRLGTAHLLKASHEYYSYLNESYQTLKTTMPTVRDDKLFPFIFYYRNQWNKECFVKFYDIAGETTEEATALLNHSGTMEATTLLIILDPNQLNNGMFAHTQNLDSNDYSTASSVVSFNDDIHGYITQSIALHLDLGAFRNINQIIAVFSKMDMVLTGRREAFGAGRMDVNCAVRFDLGNDHRGGLDVSVINQVGYDLDRFVNYELGTKHSNLRMYLRSLFPPERKINMNLLGVSTHTLVDAKEIKFANYCQEAAPKHRIIEPFLCILAQNGMIPLINVPREQAAPSGKKEKN